MCQTRGDDGGSRRRIRTQVEIQGLLLRSSGRRPSLLSPDEIFALAEAQAREANRLAPSSYNDAIRLATGKIRERLKLPEYESWAAQYLEDPSRFDPYLMGLWKSEE